MFITFSFRIIVLFIGYYASLGGEDTSQAKDFGIGGVPSWLDGGLESLLLDNNLKLSILIFLFADNHQPTLGVSRQLARRKRKTPESR
jgi:hypothetical protein